VAQAFQPMPPLECELALVMAPALHYRKKKSILAIEPKTRPDRVD